jgi:hypothetical protein
MRLDISNPSGMAKNPTVPVAGERHRPARPPCCRSCDGACWWNGWRLTHPLLVSDDGGAERVERWLPRAKCSLCHKGFTCHPAPLYPRRQYQLDVVARVVGAMVFGAESASSAAKLASASPTSARRWRTWVASLLDGGEGVKLCARLWPESPAGAGLSMVAGSGLWERAARVLSVLEELGAALIHRGRALVSRTGLGRVLEYAYAQHSEVVGLVVEPKRLSPAMAFGDKGTAG